MFKHRRDEDNKETVTQVFQNKDYNERNQTIPNHGTIGATMMAVHFAAIPCEFNTANRVQKQSCFCEIRSSTNNTVDAGFESLKLYESFYWCFHAHQSSSFSVL